MGHSTPPPPLVSMFSVKEPCYYRVRALLFGRLRVSGICIRNADVVFNASNEILPRDGWGGGNDARALTEKTRDVNVLNWSPKSGRYANETL